MRRYSLASVTRHPSPSLVTSPERRIVWIGMFFLLGMLVIMARFFQLQVLERHTYQLLASDQHDIQTSLTPRRGTIYVRDRFDGSLHPVAKDRDAWQIYAIPRQMKQGASSTAVIISGILQLPTEELVARFTSPTATYMVIARDVSMDVAYRVRDQKLPGIGIVQGLVRLYPERAMSGQLVGFTTVNEQGKRVGKYGLEGYFQDTLAGKEGSLIAEKDAAGRRLTIGSADIKHAENGASMVLTIDRTIQYQACTKIQAAVERFQAESGSVIILDAKTGGVLAMCSAPDFAPGEFRYVDDVGIYNNPTIFYQYEPGSIFKPFTMAAGLEEGKISPQSTYTDPGSESIDGFTIRNADKETHGLQTMTQVLEKSLNTGTIFVQRLLGQETFRTYVKKFGFGEKTHIPLHTEVKGNIAALERKGRIFFATASFGQGITVTPIQMTAAYLALANGGQLMRPHLVSEIHYADGHREIKKPEIVAQVVSTRTSRLVSAMMVNVIENGHGKQAGVPGYYVAGKTGTAQIPNPNGQGYLQDQTIGSFAGYAPADHPAFVMLVKIDRPKTVQYAESSAAPVFGELAKFLLSYMQVPPERPIIKRPSPPALPVVTSAAPSSTR